VPHRPIFHPRIEADVREAVTYYDGRSAGLGERFKRTFYATVDDILFFPAKSAVKVDEEIRTRLNIPFPYLVFYVVETEVVFILAVQYAGRRPAYLRSVARERRLAP
jgi:ParE toxin of type II toxin-antitoxin system, parDE